MHFRRAILILALLTAASSAVPIDLTFAVPVMAVVIIALLAMMGMLAGAISNPQLEAWVKTEIREFIAGIILIGLVMVLFFGSNGVAVALTGRTDFLNAAQSTIVNGNNGWVDHAVSSFDDIISAATALRVAASYSSGTSVPIYWVSLNYQTGPLAGISIFLVPLNLAAQGLSNIIFLGEGMAMLMAFLGVVIPHVLLPIAFIVRLIPFTRRAGNTLIAICVAGIVFLPVSVIFADALNGQIGIPAARMTDMSALDSNPYPVLAFSPICEFKVIRLLFSLTDIAFAAIGALPCLMYYAVCFDILWHVVYPILSIVFQIANGVLLITWEAVVNPSNYGTDVYNALQPFLLQVNDMVMVIYLDIIFIAIVTFSGARSLSTALGGEWYMAGVQRLI